MAWGVRAVHTVGPVPEGGGGPNYQPRRFYKSACRLEAPARTKAIWDFLLRYGLDLGVVVQRSYYAAS